MKDISDNTSLLHKYSFVDIIIMLSTHKYAHTAYSIQNETIYTKYIKDTQWNVTLSAHEYRQTMLTP